MGTLALAGVLSCGRGVRPATEGRPVPGPERPQPGVPMRPDSAGVADRIAWVAVASRADTIDGSATTDWRVMHARSGAVLARGRAGVRWRVERRGARLRLLGDSAVTLEPGNALVVIPLGDGVVQLTPARGAAVGYRGDLRVSATDSGLLVVNRLPVEAYLQGVVPLEIGTRSPGDRAAMEAQAIAARSYTYVRVPAGTASGAVPASGWHLIAGVTNQVYGGVNAEVPVVSAAVAVTAGQVVLRGGVPVDAPYSAACGGRSAVPAEAWSGAATADHLGVDDDTNPATGRPYCDLTPRNHWTATFDQAMLADAVRRTLVARGAGIAGGGLSVRAVEIGAHGPSGRVQTLRVETSKGTVELRASEIRPALRDARGAILSSTYFSVERQARRRGQVTELTLRGAGNGHGVGLCQWGAIGRARAGQDALTILRHYYPGTTIGVVR